VHLGLAFVILGLIAWHVHSLGRSEAELLHARRGREGRLLGLSTGLMHLALVQIILGALVAGIDAGRAFPTWPLMNGQFFPANAFYVPDGPVWRAFFENEGLVQFIHRMTGYALAAFVIVAWLRGRRSAHRATRASFHALLAMTGAQIVLGIWAVLTLAALPVALAHQVGAVVLWVLVIRARHMSLYPRAGSIREGTA
jgi:cytochrome c oxidase assembly protein subunit 15